nr:hypothetical protein [Tanacetum cinerariifolium]
GGYVREFESRVRQDMDEIYTRLDDEQNERQLLAGRLNMLFRDRRAHAHTRLLMEAEARMSKDAWKRAIDASDLVHGEAPPSPEQAPPSPDYVPGPKHADDEIVAEEQPYAEDASPIAQSPEYVLESDFEAHPEDDDDEDPEEDPVDYPADGGDYGDDEEESSKDDEDDEMDIEADEEEEEEEHPAPADSVVVAPTTADQAPSAE